MRHLLIKSDDGRIIAVLDENDAEELVAYYAGIPELEEWLREES